MYTILLHRAMICWSLLTLTAATVSRDYWGIAARQSAWEVWGQGPSTIVLIHLPCLLLGLKTIARRHPPGADTATFTADLQASAHSVGTGAGGSPSFEAIPAVSR